jgi:hypothetical protein
MANYIVLDIDVRGRRVALLDRSCGRHIARVAAELPPVGTRLQGDPVAPGHVLMHDPGCGQVYRFTLEAIDCGEDGVRDWLHSDIGPFEPSGTNPASGPRGRSHRR